MCMASYQLCRGEKLESRRGVHLLSNRVGDMPFATCADENARRKYDNRMPERLFIMPGITKRRVSVTIQSNAKGNNGIGPAKAKL